MSDRTPRRRRDEHGAIKSLASILSLALTCVGCGDSAGPRDAEPIRVRKVIVISIDTLRADYLTPYDPRMTTSPRLADLASESVLFTDALAQGGSTVPSHHSLFYGLYPWIHKAVVAKSIAQATVKPPVERLREDGFLTAGFVGGGKVSERFGFGTGFDLYTDVSRFKGEEADKRDWEQRRIPELERLTTRWLDEHHADDFFLFVHTYKVHCPYDPPEEYARKYTSDYRGGEYRCGVKRAGLVMDESYFEYVRALYAGEVEYVDAFIGRLVDRLKALGIHDETMIVVLADHGELLGEQNEIGHNSIHDTCLRVPLLIRVPGVPPRRVEDPVELIDVMPTVFSAVGIEPPFRFQGTDLLPVMTGKASIDSGRIRFSSSGSIVAVRAGQWKLVFSTLHERNVGLYDLGSAAGEDENLAAVRPDLVADLRERFERMLRDNADLAAQFVLAGEEEAPVVDEQVLDQLRTLGYVE